MRIAMRKVALSVPNSRLRKGRGAARICTRTLPVRTRVFAPREFEAACKALERGGADSVLEVAGGDDTFELAWKCARPNAVVVIVAMYGKPQSLPLPDMYGKNLTFKTGGVDGCDCDEILRLIAEGKLDTSPLVTHTFPLSRADEAYALFEGRKDGVIKVALKP